MILSVNKTMACALVLSTTLIHAEGHAQEAANNDEPRTLNKLVAVAEDANATEGSDSYTTDNSSTATGLDLTLRDTPQSVSVITRERMDDQAMTTVADALRNTTGVSVKAVDRGRNNVSVRGFDVTSFQYDGVPVATGNIGGETGNAALYDRVEVVRGATGLLSGAGNPSAAINLVRKHADSDVFTGSVSAELGSWNQRTGTIDLSAPLTQSGAVRGRMVVSYSQQDAFIDLENTKNTLFYGVLDADLGDSTLLSIGASDQHDKRNGVLWAGLPYWYADGSHTDWDRSKTTATRWNQWDTTEQTVFATLKHTFANQWSLRANASYHRQVEDSKLLWMWGDPDRQTGLGLDAYPYHYFIEPKQTNIAVMVTGPFTLWGREQELTAGLIYSKLSDGWSNRDPLSAVVPVGNFNTWDGSYPEPAMTDSYVGSKGVTTQAGMYVAARLQLLEKLKFIAGARLSDWRREEQAGAWTAQPYEVKEDNIFTPYAGLIYALTNHVSAYASYTDIFNSQTYYRDRNGDYLDPLQGNSYEAGLKGEFLDGNLNASAAVFRIDQDNFAVADVGYLVPDTTDQAYYGAQGVKAQGYELEVSGDIASGWNVGVSWTAFSARDAEHADVAVEHPRKMFKLFTKYALSGVQGLSIGGGVNWESATPITAINPVTGIEERVGQPAYALVELMAKYAFNEQWSLQANIYNALDETYKTNSSWWGATYTYGEPRKALLTADYRF